MKFCLSLQATLSIRVVTMTRISRHLLEMNSGNCFVCAICNYLRYYNLFMHHVRDQTIAKFMNFKGYHIMLLNIWLFMHSYSTTVMDIILRICRFIWHFFASAGCGAHITMSDNAYIKESYQ